MNKISKKEQILFLYSLGYRLGEIASLVYPDEEPSLARWKVYSYIYRYVKSAGREKLIYESGEIIRGTSEYGEEFVDGFEDFNKILWMKKRGMLRREDEIYFEVKLSLYNLYKTFVDFDYSGMIWRRIEYWNRRFWRKIWDKRVSKKKMLVYFYIVLCRVFFETGDMRIRDIIMFLKERIMDRRSRGILGNMVYKIKEEILL